MAKTGNIGKLMSKNVDVIGMHVTYSYTDVDSFERRTLLGTIKGILHCNVLDIFDNVVGYERRLEIRFFNGEQWPEKPLPYLVERV